MLLPWGRAGDYWEFMWEIRQLRPKGALKWGWSTSEILSGNFFALTYQRGVALLSAWLIRMDCVFIGVIPRYRGQMSGDHRIRSRKKKRQYLWHHVHPYIWGDWESLRRCWNSMRMVAHNFLKQPWVQQSEKRHLWNAAQILFQHLPFWLYHPGQT